MFNRCAYSWNDPVNRIDPDGRYSLESTEQIILDVAYAAYKPVIDFFTEDAVAAVDSAKQGDVKGVVGSATLAIVKPAKVISKGKKTYQTYIKRSETQDVGDYSGRTSGTGTPAQNVANRDRNHHMNETHGPAELDKSSSNSDAIRGREDQNILANGGAQSANGASGNRIRGIAESDPKKDQYEKACKDEFC